MCVCVCCRVLVSFLLLLLLYPFWFCFSCFSLMLLRYSKMQFYSCQGNLTPSAKMQALLAITSAPTSPPSPYCSLYSCHVVPAPVVVVAAVFCLATLRYFLANDEVSRYILLLLPLFFFVSRRQRKGAYTRHLHTRFAGREGEAIFSLFFFELSLCFMHCVQSVNKRQSANRK